MSLAQTGALPEEIFAPTRFVDIERLTQATYDLCELNTTSIEACISAMKVDFENDWPALDAYFDHQIDCWRDFAKSFGYFSFSEFIEFPWKNAYSAAFMPNTRHYEHFYDQVGCNQIWTMGRGGVQPDAITFYDVSAHERNVIITDDRVVVTPWLSHDERVLQFFGITDRCVELYAENEVNAGQGLGGEGQWRIEYYNATGHVYINSTDLGKTVGEARISAAASSPLEEENIHICRTPFYLQICTNEDAPVNKGIGGCPSGCEYFPAFTATDDSLSAFAVHGTYNAHCGAGDILSFNGTRSAATRGVLDDFDLEATPTQTPEIHFEDGCESENFLVLDGQEVHIKGTLLGTMEILISEDICATACAGPNDDICDDIALVFERPSNISTTPFTYTYNELCDAMQEIGIEPNVETFVWEAQNPTRFFVYSAFGSHSICDSTCYRKQRANCIIVEDAYGVEPNAFNVNVYGADFENEPPRIVSSRDDDPMPDGGGNAFPFDILYTYYGTYRADGESGDDFIEDLFGNAEMFARGREGSDTMTSRGGRDALWGGNSFKLNNCEDDL